jgi:starch synthase (maltosyl-transferring)
MTPLIYNLFPRLVGPLDRWAEHARHAANLGFNWLYLNPWHYPGFSGSLYAPKEFYRLNPLFLPPGSDVSSLEPLRIFLAEADSAGLRVMMDLVVNHTSKDCFLADEHPDWYVRDAAGQLVSPSVIDPDDPKKVTVWGDLAEIDNRGARDREGLWGYWVQLVESSLDLGFSGFRCDAAYMVPAELWRLLIDRARARRPEVLFFAETLGAPERDVLALRDAGFDFFFNSSKWWDFEQEWALEQHERFGRIAPSISFPETHDTTRLAADTGGDEAVQRQRYAFAIGFSAGVMMPIGYEYGFRRKTDVVHTMPSDWERRSFDLGPFVRRANRLKLATPILQGEGNLTAPEGLGRDLLVLERRVDGVDGLALIVVNTSADTSLKWDVSRSIPDPAGYALHRIFEGEGGEEVPSIVHLERAEVVYLLPKYGRRESMGHGSGRG